MISSITQLIFQSSIIIITQKTFIFIIIRFSLPFIVSLSSNNRNPNINTSIMKRIIVLIIAIFMINVAEAQWQQTSFDSFRVDAMLANGNNIFAGTRYNGIYLSIDNGLNWTAVDSGLTDINIGAFTKSGNNIYVGTSSSVFRSTDNGQSWTSLGNNIGFPVKSLAAIGDNIFAGVDWNGMYLFRDTATNWIAADSGLVIDAVFSLAVSGTNVFAGTQFSGLFLSKDTGTSWIQVDSALVSGYCVYAIAANDSNIFVGSNGISTSSNNGITWTADNNGLTNYYIKSFAVTGSYILAGAYNAIFLSTNNGSSWINVSGGLTTGTIFSIAISGNYIFVGTGSGVWRSTFADLLGIKENTVNNIISVYPNPAKETITIETDATNQRLEITNLIGQTVYTSYIYNKKATINTSAFAKGVYILKLSSDKETVVRKFVKE